MAGRNMQGSRVCRDQQLDGTQESPIPKSAMEREPAILIWCVHFCSIFSPAGVGELFLQEFNHLIISVLSFSKSCKFNWDSPTPISDIDGLRISIEEEAHRFEAA